MSRLPVVDVYIQEQGTSFLGTHNITDLSINVTTYIQLQNQHNKNITV